VVSSAPTANQGATHSRLPAAEKSWSATLQSYPSEMYRVPAPNGVRVRCIKLWRLNPHVVNMITLLSLRNAGAHQGLA